MATVTGDAAKREHAAKRQRSRERANAERRIFAVRDDLRRNLSTIDVNTIDGEFFFRFCCPGFEEFVDALRRDRDGSDESAAFHAALQIRSVFGVPLVVAQAHVEHRARLRLRDPEVLVGTRCEGRQANLRPVDDHVTLKVWKRNATGKDVVGWLEEAGLRPGPLDFEAPPSGGFSAEVVNGDAWSRVKADLQAHHEEYWEWEADARTQDGRILGSWQKANVVGAPHILVRFNLPLPPSDFVAANFDGWMRVNGADLRDLLPRDTAQDKVVALRTWTIGLLTRNGGHSRDIAQDRWCRSEPGAKSVSLTTLTNDRRSLYLRVPEAEYYLDCRRQSPSA